MEIQFTSQILKEEKLFVAYSPELDISSCGGTQQKAQENLLAAVRLFLEEAEKKGSLDQILEEAGFIKRGRSIEGPRFISVERLSISLPLVHAKA